MSWSLYLEYKNSADSDFSIVSFACVHRFSAVFLSPFLFACPLFLLLASFFLFLTSSACYLPAVSFSVLLLSNLCSAAYLYRSYVASKLHQSPTYFQERYADEESMRSVLHHRCLFCSMHVELHTLDFSQCEFDNEN